MLLIVCSIFVLTPEPLPKWNMKITGPFWVRHCYLDAAVSFDIWRANKIYVLEDEKGRILTYGTAETYNKDDKLEFIVGCKINEGIVVDLNVKLIEVIIDEAEVNKWKSQWNEKYRLHWLGD